MFLKTGGNTVFPAADGTKALVWKSSGQRGSYWTLSARLCREESFPRRGFFAEVEM
jgi:hypothetical protein